MSPYRATERRSRKLGSPARAWRDGPAGRRAYDVPWPASDRRASSGRWTPESVVSVEVHGRPIDVVADRLLGDHVHVCAPDDVGDPNRTLRWPRSLTPEDVEELGRLRAAGFSVQPARRGHDVQLDAVSVHRWLLSRTVPHEVGHWVDYRRRVLDPLSDDASAAEYHALVDRWMQRPRLEREAFADRYADAMSASIRDALDHPRTDLHRHRPGGTRH